MTQIALTEEETRIDETSGYEDLPIAERFFRDRTALSDDDPAIREEAAVRLVEFGSSSVAPLLNVVETDASLQVRKAALWSLLYLTDDLLGGSDEEAERIAETLQRNPQIYRTLRLGLEAFHSRANGGSPARVASGWLPHVDRASRQAALQFLRDLTREAPDLDPELPSVLRRANRNPFPGVRREARVITAEFESGRASGITTERSVRFARLTARRAAFGSPPPSGVSGDEFLLRALEAAGADPDRTVRHAAAAQVYRLVRSGTKAAVIAERVFRDREVRYLFAERAEELRTHRSAARALHSLLTSHSSRRRQCALRLLIPLRAAVDGVSGAEIDELVRPMMRDPSRNVRREATAVARAAATEYTHEEVAGRLRETVRDQRVVFQLSALQVGSTLVGLLIGVAAGKLFPWLLVSQLIGTITSLARMRERGKKHGMSQAEYLETLYAMEPLAEVSPDKLRASLPELRALSTRMAEPNVRAKARELIAKIDAGVIHELPIAASASVTEIAALPIPDEGVRRMNRTSADGGTRPCREAPTSE